MNFEEWITGITKTEKPSKKIIAFYFGLFESADNEYMMYLSGSREFDGDGDWACYDDFEPKEKYLPLAQYKGLGWEVVLDNVVATLQEFVKTDLYLNSFFSKAKGIATGFDNGDLTLITV